MTSDGENFGNLASFLAFCLDTSFQFLKYFTSSHDILRLAKGR